MMMVWWCEDYLAGDRVRDRVKDRAKGGAELRSQRSSVSRINRHYAFSTGWLATIFWTDPLKNPVLECTSTGVDMAIIKLLE